MAGLLGESGPSGVEWGGGGGDGELQLARGRGCGLWAVRASVHRVKLLIGWVKCNTLCLSTPSESMVFDCQRRATADEGRLRTGKEGDEYAAAGVPGCSRARGCACTTNRCCCCVVSWRPGENLSVAAAAAAPVLCLLVEGSVLNLGGRGACSFKDLE